MHVLLLSASAATTETKRYLQILYQQLCQYTEESEQGKKPLWLRKEKMRESERDGEKVKDRASQFLDQTA